MITLLAPPARRAASQTAQIPASLGIVAQPSGAADGDAFTIQPSIEILDQAGNRCTGSTATVTVSKASGSGTLSGDTSVDAVAGVLTFADLEITGTGAHTLAFASSGLAGVTSESFDVAASGGIPADVVFRLAWRTGTGTGDAAVRDTDATIPWDLQSGNGTLNTVIASTGLDFPCVNVYKTIAEFSAAYPSQSNFTDQLRIQEGNAYWDPPAIGESLYYRWYQRYMVPDLDTDDARPHTVQDGVGAGSSNWMWETPVNNDETWSPAFNFAPVAFPNNRWKAAALPRNETYRIEFQFHRTGTSSFLPHCRIYDSAGVLVRSDADFKNQDGAGSTTFATTSDLSSFRNLATLSGFQMGNNGTTWDIAEEDHPFDGYAFGVPMIRTEDWCGPYTAAEETP